MVTLSLIYLPTRFNIDAGKVPEKFQLELIDIQNSEQLKGKYNEVGCPDFYKYVEVEKFPLMHMFAARMLSMFGSTYICESMFSKMRNTKNKHRSTLTDHHLRSLLKLSTAQTIEPAIDRLVANKKVPSIWS